jgi:hypothetical protein
MTHFSESEWRRACAVVRHQQRRDFLLALAYLAAVAAGVADVWLRAEHSWLGQLMAALA